MIFKGTLLLLVNDNKLYHLLRLRNSYALVVLKRFFYVPNISSNILSSKYSLVCHSKLEMSSNATARNVFQGKEDRFEGITVFSDHELCDESEFEERLKNSLHAWRSSKKRGIWFKVHLDQCEWVPRLVKNGFKYHHAKEDYVMLYLWLPDHECNNIPNYAHTMVGVGAVVTNKQGQILVVKERYFYKIPMWKLPGGYVEPGENFVDASVREVLEETGVQSEFQTLLTLRHAHGGMFGCSDIYIVVSLRALTDDIQKCEREIADCQWMDIEEYLSHPHVHDLNRFFVRKLMHHRKHNLKVDCHHGVHQLLQKPYTVYSVVKTDDVEESARIATLSVGGSSKSS